MLTFAFIEIKRDFLFQTFKILLLVTTALVDWETHQLIHNSEASSYREWRAAAFKPCFAQRITNTVKLSNPVVRSFVIITSAVFLFKF